MPLYSRILEIYIHPAYISLVSVAFFVFFLNHVDRSCLNHIPLILFAIVLSIPILMNLAGRFPTYYYWMSYLPLFLLVVILAGLTKNRRNHCIIGLVTLFLVIQGSIGSSRRNNYSDIECFMSRCTMLRNKSVVAPFSVFYEIERLGCDTYYLGVYPPRNLPDDIDYIILPERSADYGNDRLYDYFEAVSQSDSQQLVLVAENKYPKLKVYQIKTD